MKAHPLINYWQNTFSQYSEDGQAFRLPLFPDPLMSPRFGFHAEEGHFNRIDDRPLAPPEGFRLAKQFKLGTCRLENRAPSHFDVELLPLHRSVLREDFWKILEQSFAKDMPFLRKLLPFLPCTNAKYRTAFIKHEGENAGLVNVGVSGGVGLVLTAAILPQTRGLGLCNHIVGISGDIAKEMGASTAVYWTEHDFLLKYADEVHEYQVFVRHPLTTNSV